MKLTDLESHSLAHRGVGVQASSLRRPMTECRSENIFVQVLNYIFMNSIKVSGPCWGHSLASRAKPEGNVEVGWYVHTTQVFSHSLKTNQSLGMYQEIHSFSAMNIDSSKFNISLKAMRECCILLSFL